MEFERMFRTERACRDYLIRFRWPNGFRCPSCGHGQAWQTRRRLFHCGQCRRDTSATAGTIFHRSRLSLRIWFRAIWWMTNQKSGVSALGLQRTLGLGSYETAWACLHKLRRAMVRPGRELLNGEVEVDETFVGGYEVGGGRRHVGKKALVAVAAEMRGKGIGRIRLRRISDSSETSLTGFVRWAISPGATVVTDGWAGYEGLAGIGYLHRPLTIGPDKKQATVLFPRVHRVAALLKRWLLGIHQGAVSREHLDRYLEEFAFRFNRRLSTQRGMLFHRLVQQAAVVPPDVPRKPVLAGIG